MNKQTYLIVFLFSLFGGPLLAADQHDYDMDDHVVNGWGAPDYDTVVVNNAGEHNYDADEAINLGYLDNPNGEVSKPVTLSLRK